MLDNTAMETCLNGTVISETTATKETANALIATQLWSIMCGKTSLKLLWKFAKRIHLLEDALGTWSYPTFSTIMGSNSCSAEKWSNGASNSITPRSIFLANSRDGVKPMNALRMNSTNRLGLICTNKTLRGIRHHIRSAKPPASQLPKLCLYPPNHDKHLLLRP